MLRPISRTLRVTTESEINAALATATADQVVVDGDDETPLLRPIAGFARASAAALVPDATQAGTPMPSR